MSSSPPQKIETLPSAWIGCKITTFIWNTQIKFYNLLKLALIYTIFVNLYTIHRRGYCWVLAMMREKCTGFFEETERFNYRKEI